MSLRRSECALIAIVFSSELSFASPTNPNKLPKPLRKEVLRLLERRRPTPTKFETVSSRTTEFIGPTRVERPRVRGMMPLMPGTRASAEEGREGESSTSLVGAARTCKIRWSTSSAKGVLTRAEKIATKRMTFMFPSG